MITARTAHESDTTIFIGLSRQDLTHLLTGTLVLNRERVGISIPEHLEIVIAFGMTDQSILDALRTTGALAPDAVNQKDPM